MNLLNLMTLKKVILKPSHHQVFMAQRCFIALTTITMMRALVPLMVVQMIIMENMRIKRLTIYKYSSSSMSAEEIRTELETYKTRTDAIDRLEKFLGAGFKSNFEQRTLITNTRDDIVIEDYIDVFLPEGAIAIKLYIDDLGASLPDQQKYFNSGYYQGRDSFMIYLDQEGNVVVDEYRLTFPSYTNDTPKTVYDRLLKEEGTYHKKSLQSTDILENPILSEELLANIENSL